jgi:hypothetical protein
VLKEARESRLWLRVILACNLSANRQEAQQLYDEANELVAIFIAAVRRLRQPQTFAKTVVLAVLGTGSVFLVLTFNF